jgi:proline racemase
MVPSFVHELDVEIDTPQWGKIKVDLCYGGIFYALVDVGQINLTIEKANAAALVQAGMMLKEQINRSTVVHPEIPAISGVAYVMFRDVEADGTVRTCTTMWPGRADRSPCGTGNSANLAHCMRAARRRSATSSSRGRSSIRNSRSACWRRRRLPAGRPSSRRSPVAALPSACRRWRSIPSIRIQAALH